MICADIGGTPNAGLIGRVGDQEITQGDFAAYVAIVASNRQYMQSEINANSPDRDELTMLVELMDKWGASTVALAGLIQEHATYQYALQQGYSVSDEEVAAQIEQEREALAQDPSTDAMQRAIRAGMDEETFWSEVYPLTVRRELVVDRLWADRLDFQTSASQRTELVAQTEAEALDMIPITLVDGADLEGATLETARAYLDAYHQLQIDISNR